MSTTRKDPRPLIAHVLFRFDVGGLENGVVNLINHMPESRWRHAVVALDDVAPAFQRRVRRADVAYLALRKPPGHLLPHYPALFRMFRDLRPSIVHTRNLAALEATVPAWLAGVRARVHGEHGWDVQDIDGRNSRYSRVRRIYRPFVHRYIALSDQIAGYLKNKVGVDPRKVTRIYNGVDTRRFAPSDAADRRAVLPFGGDDVVVVGTVGRMQAVKDQVSLVRALAILSTANPQTRRRLRLVIVGDGPARAAVEAEAGKLGVAEQVWITGTRDDVPRLMCAFDIFCLPSLSEGISNTILEAMSTGLPVVATRVGGNPELVVEGVTGGLVPPSDPAALADALGRYLDQPQLALAQGDAGRQRIEQRFSIETMVGAYEAVYRQMLAPEAAAAVLAHGEN